MGHVSQCGTGYVSFRCVWIRLDTEDSRDLFSSKDLGVDSSHLLNVCGLDFVGGYVHGT